MAKILMYVFVLVSLGLGFGRWKENKCVTVMKDLGPCFSACKEIHHGKVIDNASPDEEAAQVLHCAKY